MSKNNNNDKSKANAFAASTRIKSKTASTLSGQIRHDLRRGPQPKYVDENRSHLNRVLIENTPIPKMRAICSERRKLRDTKRGVKSNAAIATSGIITFGSEAARMFEALSMKDQDRAFKLLTRLIARRLDTSVHGLTVHLDEATIHAHYQLAAVNKFGDPVSKSSSPRVMSELQDLTAIVMQRFCPEIERGRKYGERMENGADIADTIHKSVRELHQTLPADLAAKRQLLANLADDEIKAQARVDEMQGRVTKLQDKVDLSNREVKRLQTYESRLSDRLNELKAAQSASEAAKVEAERLADLARVDHEAARANVDRAHLAAKRIKAQGEERARQMIEGGEIAVEDIKKEVAEDRRRLKDDQRDLLNGQYELMKASEYVETLKKTLSYALSKVTRWLKRPDLPDDARVEAIEIAREAHAALLATKEPVDDAGPGL